jgi:hypothetical protein
LRDPHVNSLIFQLKTDGSVIFERARELTFLTKEFKGELQEDELVVMMMAHYASEAAARSVVEPYLRSWEMNTLLEGFYNLQFVFVRSEVVDLKPPLPGECYIIGANA